MTRLTKQASVRIGGILAGAGVLFVGGVLIASSPAMADNGPHISNAGTTSIGSGPDGCAGCHRIHSAKSDNGMLLVNASEEALCATCHEGGTGATTDVINGVQYSAPTGGTKTTQALRGGGFDFSLIGSGSATRAFSGTNIDNTQSTVPVAGTAVGTTSRHSLGTNSGTMWGNGLIGSGAGTTVSLECGSCHDPHGNGNFRILKPVGGLGAANLSVGKVINGASFAVDNVNSTPTTTPPVTKYIWNFSFAADPGFTPGQPVAISGTNFAGYDFTPSLVCSSATRCSWTQANIGSVTYGDAAAVPPVNWTISIPNMTQPQASTSVGTVSAALPNTIKSASSAGGVTTFTTYVNHGLSTGQVVTIAGASPSGYNVSKKTITVTSADTFTVAATIAAANTLGGYISGIPDSLPVAAPPVGYSSVGTKQKVYNTTNYWRADDHFYTGAQSPTGVQFPSAAGTGGVLNTTNGESAFIINASQWCTTCHTRYLAANSTSRKFSSLDTTFTFRHTSGAYKENSPDCMQCHVAHGSNAQMNGLYTSNLPTPTALPSYPKTPVGGTSDSRLLRVDNRGTCLFCHNM